MDISKQRIAKSIDITVHSLEWLLRKHQFILEESGIIKQYFDDIISEFNRYETEIAELKKSNEEKLMLILEDVCKAFKLTSIDSKDITITNNAPKAYVILEDLQTAQAKDNLNNNLSSY